MKTIASNFQLFAQYNCSAGLWPPLPIFYCRCAKACETRFSTEFTLSVSVNNKISYAIASLVVVDNVPLATSMFHKQIVSHDALFPTPLILYLVEGFSSLFSFNSATTFYFLPRFLLDRVV